MAFQINKQLFGRLQQIFGIERPETLQAVNDSIQPVWDATKPFEKRVTFMPKRSGALPAFDFELIRIVDNINIASNPPVIQTRLLDSIVINRIDLFFNNFGATVDGNVRIRLSNEIAEQGSVRFLIPFEETFAVPVNTQLTVSRQLDLPFHPLYRIDESLTGDNGFRRLQLLAFEQNGAGTNVNINTLITATVKFRYEGEAENNPNVRFTLGQ